MNQTLGPSDEILQLKMLELGKRNVRRKKPRQNNGRKAYFYDFFLVLVFASRELGLG